jgi:hypothetical protein
MRKYGSQGTLAIWRSVPQPVSDDPAIDEGSPAGMPFTHDGEADNEAGG